MDATDIEKLKGLAEAATPVAWARKWHVDGVNVMGLPKKERPRGWYMQSATDIRIFPDDTPLYACNPSTILALLSELESERAGRVKAESKASATEKGLKYEIAEADLWAARAHAAEAQLSAMREALEGLPAILSEIHSRWDDGMKAGKLLIALMDPSLKYRADVTAIHAARAALTPPEPSP